VITGLLVGGSEMQLARLLEAMPKEEYEWLVVSLLPEGPLATRFAGMGVRVVSLGMKRGVPSLSATTTLRRELRDFQPTLVHGWMYHGNLASWIGIRGLPGIPLVWTILQTLYARNEERLGTRLAIRAGAILSRGIDALVYNSNVAREQHERRGFRPRRTLVIPNGFDVDAFRPFPGAKVRLRGALGLPADRQVVGLVNRFHPMKGHTIFLRAARMLLDAGADVSFVCVGRDVVMSNPILQRTAQELGILHRLHLLGERLDTAELFAGFDVTCCSSVWGEGFPNVIGESMACGTPCVVTDVGDAAVAVGSTGVVVPPNDPQALANGILSLLRLGEDERGALGGRARDRIVTQFPVHEYARAHGRLYRELGAAAVGP